MKSSCPVALSKKNEGWANFFSVVCQSLQGVSSPKLGNAGDDQFYSYPAEGRSGHGEDEELSNYEILWDLYDSGTDGGKDNVAMGISDLYTFLDTHNPLTLDELWDSLMSTAPNLATKLQYAEIFELNHVSPNIVGAQIIGSAAPATKSLSVTKTGPSPKFTWKIPVDSNGTGQLLNGFGVLIFDDTNATVFDSGVLTTGNADGEVQIVGNTAKYIPKLSTWSSSIASKVGTTPRTFRWVVYGRFFGDETLQGNITTGDYWSGAAEIIVSP